MTYKLNLLALLFILLFCSLGSWQLSRAKQKEALIAAFEARKTLTPITAANLIEQRDLRFFRARLMGEFDNKHSFLLDNKTLDGKIGYEIYTPFFISQSNKTILVDRGFIPMPASRRNLPTITPIRGGITITGMLNKAPAYVALGDMLDPSINGWPKRIEYLALPTIATLLKQTIFPYVLIVAPHDPAAYKVSWQIVTIGPERHRGYALQWFAFAITLLIICVVLTMQKRNRH